MANTSPQVTQARNNPPKLEANVGKGWTMQGGKVSTTGAGTKYTADGAEDLTYNNPLNQTIERAWYDGKIVFAITGEPMRLTGSDQVKWAKEYQPVKSVQLDENGWMVGHQPVPGQLNVYAVVPGDERYSAVWKFYYVMVPDNYQPNSLRSEQDCLQSGYEIRESNFYRN